MRELGAARWPGRCAGGNCTVRNGSPQIGYSFRIEALPNGKSRLVYFGLAWVFFGLGILGILLPIMPGTVFMILALWAFSRSSRRFHDWLYNHRWFGPPLQRWTQYRVVPWSARIIAYGSMLGGIALSAFIIPTHPAVPISMAIVSICAILYISRCPSRMPPALDDLGDPGDVEQ